MVSGVIECGYCKKKVTRNGYGKHLLSKGHQKEFLKENKEEINDCFIHPQKKTPMTTIDRPADFKVNKEHCKICFSCKRFYMEKDCDSSYGRLESTDHFNKHPNCKANYLAELKKFTIIKKVTVNNEALEKELLYWKKEAKQLKDALECNEEEQELKDRRSEMLEVIMGNAMTRDELEIRYDYIKKNFTLPLYQ